MDGRLVLAVVLVMFSLISVGTSMNTTTVSPNVTAEATNVTTESTNMTTESTNVTEASMNMTTESTNVTEASMNMTAESTNMTAGSMNVTTASANVTAAPVNVTTAADPLPFNDTVVPLQENITVTGCGSTRLCAAEPAGCDPSVPGSCFFLGATQTSGQNFQFQLAGDSAGYICVTLSADATLGGNDSAYICANNNGMVQFFTAVLNNNVLNLMNLPANSVQGVVNGNQIQCTFEATVPDPTDRAQSSPFSLAVATGSFSNGTLGSPTARIQTPVVDISDPRTNVTNTVTPANATVAPATTNATVPLAPANATVAPANATVAPAPTNATVAPANATVAPAPANATVAPAPANATVAPAPATATVAPATAAPDLTPNNTVTPLTESITRTGCGSAHLCAAEPSNCDPSVSSSCFFLSAQQSSGQNFDFELVGQSDGFISASLSPDLTLGGNDTTYVCANVNGVATFYAALLDNGSLTITTLNVNSVRAVINGTTIQCTFSATVPVTRLRTGAMFSLAVSNGTVTRVLGPPQSRLQTPVLSLADPRANTTNVVSHAITLRNSHFQVLLIILGVLGLVVL